MRLRFLWFVNVFHDPPILYGVVDIMILKYFNGYEMKWDHLGLIVAGQGFICVVGDLH